MENQVIYIATDWWIFGATIGAGILTAIVTVVAVYYTNKWTSERYEKDKVYQDKKNSLVIIKPTLRFCSLPQIINEIIHFNVRDRVLVLSSKDGFDFYDKRERFYSENHRIFCIKNESKNRIHSIKIDIVSKIFKEAEYSVTKNVILNNYRGI